MRVVRVQYQGHSFYAMLDQDTLVCLNKDLGFNDPIPIREVSVLPPVVPTKIVCVGLNYRKHAEEMGKKLPDEPLLFLKPPSAVIASGQPIVMPPQSERVDYEGELAVVMGKMCKHVAPEDVPSCVFGYACGNDVTARDLQAKDVQYTRAKGFDTFAPIGPWIETEIEDLSNLAIRTTVNDEVRQESNTGDMIFDPVKVVSYVSGVMTLMPGDVILTGTPSGVGPVKPGDEVRIEIENVGILINPVVGPDGSPGEQKMQ